MTRLFNDPARFADEMVEGFVAANGRWVRRVHGGVARATTSAPGTVALVIGGGSGHYPAFGGLVGHGVAAGAAMGNLFASPSAQQVAAVARASHHGGGVLLSYGNYAGDVLNFGAAQRALEAEGIPVRTVRVTDDVASAGVDERHRRRGIAGDLCVFKTAGAAAEQGRTLDEVAAVAERANERTRSFGVAFSGCSLPGADEPLFTVPEGRMAVGMGIHGERGIDETDVPSADELAELLVGRLLAELPDGVEADGAHVVPLLNGLGSVKYEELFVVFRRVQQLLAASGAVVVEPEVGELVTSFDMAGVSLTLFWPDAELEELWAAPADTPAYRKGAAVPAERVDAATLAADAATAIPPASEESQEAARRVAEAIAAARATIDEHVDELGRIDAVAGDGDHGIGMQRGVHAALHADAVVAVAGHRVDPAELVDVLVDGGARGGDRLGDPARGLLRLLGRRRDRRRGVGREGGGVHALGRHGGALAVGRGVGGRGPQLLELGVRPEQGQRDAGHVEAGDQLAHLGLDDDGAAGREELLHAAEDDEQLLVLHRAQAVEERHDVRAVGLHAVGQLRQEAPDQQLGELVGAGHVGLVDAALAVDAHADGHAALGHGEQRLVGAGQGAAGEGHAEGPGALVGALGDGGDLVEGAALLGRRAGGLEHAQVPGDAAAPVPLVDAGARDVVGDPHGAHRDALGLQRALGGAEVEHVAGVVAVREQHAAAVVAGPGDRRDLLGRRAGEEVSHRRTGRDAVAHQAAEGRVVAGAAADHERDGAGGRRRRPGDAAVHAPHPAAVGGDEALDHLVGEPRRVVEQAGHARASAFSCAGTAGVSPVRPRRASTAISTADSSMKKPTMNMGTW